MDTALACMKYILFTMNFFLWCLGGTLMALGVYIRSDSNFWEYADKLPLEQYYKACYIAITVGAVLLILGFLGCCAAATESTCMLIFYFVFLLIMVILEFAAAGLAWKIGNSEQLEEYLRQHIKEQVDRYQDDHQARRFMDILQLHLMCCGATDKDDYKAMHVQPPASCSDQRTNNIFYHGCSEMLRTWLEKKGALLGGIAMGLVLIQIASLIFSMCLFCAIRSETKDY